MEFSDTGIYFFEEDGRDWAEFLQTKFAEQELAVRLENVEEVNDVLYPINLLLATPAILDVGIKDNVRSMDPHQSIAVLLGVEEKDVKTHFIRDQYLKISMWEFFEMFPTEESVVSLTKCVQSRLQTLKRETKAPEYDFLPAPRPSLSSESDESAITRPVIRVATAATETGTDVFLLSNRKGSTEIEVQLNDLEFQENISTTAEYIDKATYVLRVPDPSLLDSEHSFVQDSQETSICIQGTIPKIPPLPHHNYRRYIPTKEDLIRQILGFQDEPLPIFCQCFNLNMDSTCETETELFDKNLSSWLTEQKDVKLSQWNSTLQTDVEEDEKIPTLLHFAAEHNLQCLTNDLLEIPGSIHACLKMNSDKETPQMIAHRNEFKEVSQAIKSFVKREKVLGKVPNNTDSGIIEEKKLNTIYELHEDNTAKGLKKKSGMWPRLKMPTIKKALKKSPKEGLEAYGNAKMRGRSYSTVSELDDTVPYRASLSSNSSGERCESGYYDQLKHDESEDPFDDEQNVVGQYAGKTISLSKSARF